MKRKRKKLKADKTASIVNLNQNKVKKECSLIRQRQYKFSLK